MKVIAPPVRQHSLGKPNELRRNGESVRGAIAQRRLPTPEQETRNKKQEKSIPDVEGRLDLYQVNQIERSRARGEVTLRVIANCNNHQCPDR
jgi:hypothetical protein